MTFSSSPPPVPFQYFLARGEEECGEREKWEESPAKGRRLLLRKRRARRENDDRYFGLFPTPPTLPFVCWVLKGGGGRGRGVGSLLSSFVREPFKEHLAADGEGRGGGRKREEKKGEEDGEVVWGGGSRRHGVDATGWTKLSLMLVLFLPPPPN